MAASGTYPYVASLTCLPNAPCFSFFFCFSFPWLVHVSKAVIFSCELPFAGQNWFHKEEVLASGKCGVQRKREGGKEAGRERGEKGKRRGRE